MVGTATSDKVERWPLARLKIHPENVAIFEQPEASGEVFLTVLRSIEENGIWEPLLVKPDGTILAGHLRRACAERLGLAEVPVRVWKVGSELEEMTLLIRSNTDRRQLTKREIGLAVARLSREPRATGGAKAPRGRPPKDGNQGPRPTFSKTRDLAANLVGVGPKEAAACATVFATPGVPKEVQDAVNDGRVGPTTVARAIKAEVERQGGKLTSGEPLVAKFDPKEWDKRPDHVKRLQAEADRFHEDCDQLLELYKRFDKVLKRRPLATVLGPSDNEEYRGLIEGFAERVWVETEGDHGKTAKATLTVIKGGRE